MSPDLLARFAEPLGLTPAEARPILARLIASIHRTVEEQGGVFVPGLGSFRSDGAALSFEAAPDLAESINHRYVGLAPLVPRGSAPLDTALPSLELDAPLRLKLPAEPPLRDLGDGPQRPVEDVRLPDEIGPNEATEQTSSSSAPTSEPFTLSLGNAPTGADTPPEEAPEHLFEDVWSTDDLPPLEPLELDTPLSRSASPQDLLPAPASDDIPSSEHSFTDSPFSDDLLDRDPFEDSLAAEAEALPVDEAEHSPSEDKPTEQDPLRPSASDFFGFDLSLTDDDDLPSVDEIDDETSSPSPDLTSEVETADVFDATDIEGPPFSTRWTTSDPFEDALADAFTDADLSPERSPVEAGSWMDDAFSETPSTPEVDDIADEPQTEIDSSNHLFRSAPLGASAFGQGLFRDTSAEKDESQEIALDKDGSWGATAEPNSAAFEPTPDDRAGSEPDPFDADPLDAGWTVVSEATPPSDLPEDSVIDVPAERVSAPSSFFVPDGPSDLAATPLDAIEYKDEYTDPTESSDSAVVPEPEFSTATNIEALSTDEPTDDNQIVEDKATASSDEDDWADDTIEAPALEGHLTSEDRLSAESDQYAESDQGLSGWQSTSWDSALDLPDASKAEAATQHDSPEEPSVPALDPPTAADEGDDAERWDKEPWLSDAEEHDAEADQPSADTNASSDSTSAPDWGDVLSDDLLGEDLGGSESFSSFFTAPPKFDAAPSYMAGDFAQQTEPTAEHREFETEDVDLGHTDGTQPIDQPDTEPPSGLDSPLVFAAASLDSDVPVGSDFDTPAEPTSFEDSDEAESVTESHDEPWLPDEATEPLDAISGETHVEPEADQDVDVSVPEPSASDFFGASPLAAEVYDEESEPTESSEVDETNEAAATTSDWMSPSEADPTLPLGSWDDPPPLAPIGIPETPAEAAPTSPAPISESFPFRNGIPTADPDTMPLTADLFDESASVSVAANDDDDKARSTWPWWLLLALLLLAVPTGGYLLWQSLTTPDPAATVATPAQDSDPALAEQDADEPQLSDEATEGDTDVPDEDAPLDPFDGGDPEALLAEETPDDATAVEADDEPTVEEAPPPAPAGLYGGGAIDLSQGGYTWVVTADVNAGPSAQQQVAQYRAQGLRSGVVLGTVNEAQVERVCLGQFATLESARAARSQLPGSVPSSSWILNLNSPTVQR